MASTPTPTPNDTFYQIALSGAESHSWYRTFDIGKATMDVLRRDGRNADFTGWTIDVKMDNGLNGAISMTLNHDHTLAALKALADPHTPPVHSTPSARANAAQMFTDPDDTDFDAGAADEVIQLAVLGKIIYG